MGFKEDIRQRLLDLEQENLKIKDKIYNIQTMLYDCKNKIRLYELLFKELDIEVFNSDQFAALKKILSEEEIKKFKSYCNNTCSSLFSLNPNDYWYFRKLKKGKK